MNTTTANATASDFWYHFWRGFRALWLSGNYVTMITLRGAVLLAVGWPFFLMALALVESGPLIAFMTLLFLAGGLIALTFFPYPLLIPVADVAIGRIGTKIPELPKWEERVWKTIKNVFSAELLLSQFLAIAFFSPATASKAEYIPMLLLGIVSLLTFFWMGWTVRGTIAGITTAYFVLVLKFGSLGFASLFNVNGAVASQTVAVQAPAPSTTFTVSSGDGDWTVPLGKITLIIPAGQGSTHWVNRPPMAKHFTIIPSSDMYVQREFQETKRYSGEAVHTRKLGDWRLTPLSGLREADWMPVTKARFTRNPYGETRVTIETD